MDSAYSVFTLEIRLVGMPNFAGLAPLLVNLDVDVVDNSGRGRHDKGADPRLFLLTTLWILWMISRFLDWCAGFLWITHEITSIAEGEYR